MSLADDEKATPDPIAAADLEMLETVKREFWRIVHAARESIDKTCRYAPYFIRDIALNPCPHGGGDEKCECYPHQARRWMTAHGLDYRTYGR